MSPIPDCSEFLREKGMIGTVDAGETYSRLGAYMQIDYKIHEFNRRLQQRPDGADNLWWEQLACEFFEHDAVLALSFYNEEGQKRYTIGRTLIPSFFRSIYEGGANELYFLLKDPRESVGPAGVTMVCENAVMITQYGPPSFTQVSTEGKLVLECSYDEPTRIRSWVQHIGLHKEFVPRDIVAMQVQDSSSVESLSKNLTRLGLSNQTLNFLKLAVILEPMQDLMSRHKTFGLSPRDCLKTALYQKWQAMTGNQAISSPQVAPPIKPVRQPKRTKRARKGSTATNAKEAKASKSVTSPTTPPANPPPSASSSQPQDVMVVGEPILMSGEIGEEDERRITRLENNNMEVGVTQPSRPSLESRGSGADSSEGAPLKSSVSAPDALSSPAHT